MYITCGIFVHLLYQVQPRGSLHELFQSVLASHPPTQIPSHYCLCLEFHKQVYELANQEMNKWPASLEAAEGMLLMIWYNSKLLYRKLNSTAFIMVTRNQSNLNNFIRNYYFLNSEFEHYITAILQPDVYMAIVTCNMWLWKPHNCVLLNTCLEIVNAYYGYDVSKVSQILWSILCYMKLIWQQELLTMYSKQSHMSFPS
jgi:hypothetical protein